MRAVLSALVATVALVVTGQPAHAGQARGEVIARATLHEFDQLRYNATRRDTQELLDGPGRHPTVGINHEVIQRNYRLCGRRYDRGHLIVRYSRDTDRLRAALWIEVGGAGTLDR